MRNKVPLDVVAIILAVGAIVAAIGSLSGNGFLTTFGGGIAGGGVAFAMGRNSGKP